MGHLGDVRFSLNFALTVPTVAEFPVIDDHFCHHAGTVDKRHDNDAHFIHIDVRCVVEFLLSPDGKLFRCFCYFDHPVSCVFYSGNIRICFKRIKGSALII